VRNQKRLVPAILALVAAIGLMPANGAAQVLYGSIVGVVTDSSGSSVPGATVTIRNTETNLTRTAVSNETGNYNFTNVLAGPYDLTVSLQGFRRPCGRACRSASIRSAASTSPSNLAP
jgi:hypothetical protein